MTDSIPFYLEELVCSLAEHSSDDDFIVSVCLPLIGKEKRIAEIISFLEKQKRSRTQILNFLAYEAE